MKIKRFFASILTLTILISSLSLPSFANSVINLNGNKPTYLGKNIDLNSCIEYTSPSFNGIPDRVPGDEAFYSNKGEIKLNINDQNRSYFENGGSIYIYAPKAKNKLHLGIFGFGCAYEDCLSYKPENGINSFKIDGPKQYFSQSFSSSVRQMLSFIYPNSPSSFFIFSLTFFALGSCLSWWTASKFALSALFAPAIIKTTAFLGSPILNLLGNINPNNVNFDYGIVLTDEKDEMVLNPNLPKVGNINEKAVRDWKKQVTKEHEYLVNNKLKEPSLSPLSQFTSYGQINIPKTCRFTQQDIDKLKKDIAEHKAATYAKLVNTVPINDGLVCKLDKDHPSQTFRFVINNQFPDNPHNADLFALALQNNSVNLSQTDTRVSFVASYNAINPDSNVNARLANVPLEIQQKINLIQNVGTPDIFTKALNWLSSFKDWFSFGSNTTVPAPGGPRGGQGGAPRGGPAAPPINPLLIQHQNLINTRNEGLYRQILYALERNPSDANRQLAHQINQSFLQGQAISDDIAAQVITALNNVAPAAPAAPQPPQQP